jgi:uncharacterized protein YsxB (DUF464 family)
MVIREYYRHYSRCREQDREQDMTKVQIKRCPWKVEIRLKGHAQYNPGNDIVCAALSNTCYMLLNYLLEEEPRVIESYQDDPGDFRIDINPVVESESLNPILRMFEIGIKQIADNYPKNVSLEVLYDVI